MFDDFCSICHIVEMRIPYEKRVDRYEVEWKGVSPEGDSLDKSFKYAIIKIYELWSIGHLIFPNPLTLEVFLGDNEDSSALVVYDFGMEQRVPTEIRQNFLHNYVKNNEECDPIKIVIATIKFDLMHAFFHYKGDPNYDHLHWALYGNLKGKVTDDDSFIFEDIEYEHGNKFPMTLKELKAIEDCSLWKEAV